MIFLVVILTLVIIFLLYIIFISWRRIGTYEDIIENMFDRIAYTNERLKTLDAIGSFESDDEVGFFFKEVKELQQMLGDLFQITMEGENAETKKEKE